MTLIPTNLRGQASQEAYIAEEASDDSGTPTPYGRLRVIKRNGTVVPFEASKISVAITKAFLAVEGGTAAASSRIHESCAALTEQVISTFKRRLPDGGTVHIEDIQDQVELALMRSGEHKIARDYVIYREKQATKRAARESLSEQTQAAADSITVVDTKGERVRLDIEDLHQKLHDACAGLQRANAAELLDDILKSLYDGASQKEVDKAVLATARSKSELTPEYRFVVARLEIDASYSQTVSNLRVAPPVSNEDRQQLLERLFPAYVHRGIKIGALDERLADFDLGTLAQALNAESDRLLSDQATGVLQNCYLYVDGNETSELLEVPQLLFMRVAMGLAVNETERNARAIEFYECLSRLECVMPPRVLAEAGTVKPLLIDHFASSVSSDLSSVFNTMHDAALLGEDNCSLTLDWSATVGSDRAKTKSGEQGGIPSFIELARATARCTAGYGFIHSTLSCWHIDTVPYLEQILAIGSAHSLSDTCATLAVSDLFMQRVNADQQWTLFSPTFTPDLVDLHGQEFVERYEFYENLSSSEGLACSNYKVIAARDLWDLIIAAARGPSTFHVAFTDAANAGYPQAHVGNTRVQGARVLASEGSNPVGAPQGFINLALFDRELDAHAEQLMRSASCLVRMLDNALDLSWTAVPAIKEAWRQQRPIAVGLVGMQEHLRQLKLAFGSPASLRAIDNLCELVSHSVLKASSMLAGERGSYPSFEGSGWHCGQLPFDRLHVLEERRGAEFLNFNKESQQDWESLRTRIVEVGLRNASVLSLADAGASAELAGASGSAGAAKSNLYRFADEVRVAPALSGALFDAELWDGVLLNDVKYYAGALQEIDRIPKQLRALFLTAAEIEPDWLVESLGRQQKWVDQGQDTSVHLRNADPEKVGLCVRMAWYRGLKTIAVANSGTAATQRESKIQLKGLTAASAEPVQIACEDDRCARDVGQIQLQGNSETDSKNNKGVNDCDHAQEFG
ncbi:MAG: ATP cone domain-containing protein [Pseudomonadota bacterium]